MKKIQYLICRIALLPILCGCVEDATDIDKKVISESQIIHVDLHENDPVEFFIPVNIEVEGQLTLVDSLGETLSYIITSGDNTIEIPYGTYNGIVHNFNGFSNDSLMIHSPGNDTVNKTAIGSIPNFQYRIVNHDIENSWHYLKIKCDTNFGYYTFTVWGSNNDTINSSNFTKIASYHRSIKQDSTVQLLIADTNLNQPLYKYYNISLAPLYGYMVDTLFGSWYSPVN